MRAINNSSKLGQVVNTTAVIDRKERGGNGESA